MKKISLSLFCKTGSFLIKVSVFAFLCVINPALAQQWEEPAVQEDVSQNHKTDVKRPIQKVTFGKPAQNVQTKPVVEGHKMGQTDEGKINIYMRNFEISKSLTGITSCSMSFQVYSTLSNVVSNISFRLKWPDLETPLSFDNIGSGKTVSQNHAFAGKVCYTLDRTPNVIVNRCRVKGMTQQECANHIEWVK